MRTEVPGNQSPARPVRSVGPIISASSGQVIITGIGFLPNRPVTVRIAHSGDDVVDYLTYRSDADGGPKCTSAGDRGHRNRAHHRHRPPPRPLW
jgi:hypothetical protein